MSQHYDSSKRGVVFILSIITIFISTTKAHCTPQASDVTINNPSDRITPCSITGFSTSRAAQSPLASYVLKDDDVDVYDGIIYNCSYDFVSKNIIIPDSLDNQKITGIKSSVFIQKGIINLQLPNTIKEIGDYAFYDNAIKSLVMPDSAIKIGCAAFNKNAITEVNGNPSKGLIYAKNADGTNDSTTIVSYGGAATEVDFIPNNVTTIGKYAFVLSLTKVTIPNTITSIGPAAFNWNIITEINGNPTNGIIFGRNTNGSIDSSTIVSYCGTAVYMDFIPNTVKKIGEEAFYGSALTNVIVPATIDTIGEKAFYYNNITNISFSTNGNLKHIGLDAFFENTGLNLILPNSGISNFSGWVDGDNSIYQAGDTVDKHNFYTANIPYILTNADVTVQEGNIISCSNTNGGTAITIPDTLDGQAIIGIREGSFSKKGVVSMYLPVHANLSGFSGWIDYGNNAVILDNGKYATNRFDITYIAKMPDYTLTSMDVVMQNNHIKSCSFSFGIKNITIPEILDGQTVKGIGSECFDNKGITSIQLPSTLEYIGTTSLTRNQFSSINIPANVSVIDDEAFRGSWTSYSSPLSQVIIEPGSKLVRIGFKAFNWCYSLDQINLPDSLKEIGDEAFTECSLTSVAIPKSMTHIGKQAFSYQGQKNKSLTSVTIENQSNLLVIGEGAFSANLALSGFTLPSSAINNFMYWYCSGTGTTQKKYAEGETTQVFTAEYTAQYPYTLTDNDIAVENNYITSYYKNNESLYITIPETIDGQVVKGIVELGQLGVFSFKKLESVVLPSTLEYIAANAFHTNKLTNITIPGKVVHIGHSAFHNNYIDSLILPGHASTGFIGWIDEEDTLVTKSVDGYVVTDMFVSYTTAYEILFKDYNGSLLKKDTVKHYQSALPPADPTRTGYTFTGWDKNFSSITQGITVIAQYSHNEDKNYTVIFKDWNGDTLSTQTVTEGNTAIAPTDPTRTGYTFIGWDKDFSNVTGDLTVTALYNQNGNISFTVIFKDWNGDTLSTQTVTKGNAAIAPTDPTRTGYTFTGWDKDFSNVTSDLTVTAQYSVATLIRQTEKKDKVIIYPNPVEDVLFVKIDDIALEQFFNGISIIDLTGKIVYKNTAPKTFQTIDISNLQNGVYFVKIGNEIKKVFKE